VPKKPKPKRKPKRLVPSTQEIFDPDDLSWGHRIAVNDVTGCWEFLGPRSKWGYGRLSIWRHGKLYPGYTHRIAYKYYKGQIEEGYQVDHLCRNKICCNPAHLEAVPAAENKRRNDTLRKKKS